MRLLLFFVLCLLSLNVQGQSVTGVPAAQLPVATNAAGNDLMVLYKYPFTANTTRQLSISNLLTYLADLPNWNDEIGGAAATNVYEVAAGTNIVVITNGLLYTIHGTASSSYSPTISNTYNGTFVGNASGLTNSAGKRYFATSDDFGTNETFRGETTFPPVDIYNPNSRVIFGQSMFPSTTQTNQPTGKVMDLGLGSSNPSYGVFGAGSTILSGHDHFHAGGEGLAGGNETTTHTNAYYGINHGFQTTLGSIADEFDIILSSVFFGTEGRLNATESIAVGGGINVHGGGTNRSAVALGNSIRIDAPGAKVIGDGLTNMSDRHAISLGYKTNVRLDLLTNGSIRATYGTIHGLLSGTNTLLTSDTAVQPTLRMSTESFGAGYMWTATNGLGIYAYLDDLMNLFLGADLTANNVYAAGVINSLLGFQGLLSSGAVTNNAGSRVAYLSDVVGGSATNVIDVAAGTGITIVTNALLRTISATGTGGFTGNPNQFDVSGSVTNIKAGAAITNLYLFADTPGTKPALMLETDEVASGLILSYTNTVTGFMFGVTDTGSLIAGATIWANQFVTLPGGTFNGDGEGITNAPVSILRLSDGVPLNNGTLGQFLTSQGNGGVAWSNAPAGGSGSGGLTNISTNNVIVGPVTVSPSNLNFYATGNSEVHATNRNGVIDVTIRTTGTAASAVGTDGEVQYENGGVVSGEEFFRYNSSTDVMRVPGLVVIGNEAVGSSGTNVFQVMTNGNLAVWVDSEGRLHGDGSQLTGVSGGAGGAYSSVPGPYATTNGAGVGIFSFNGPLFTNLSPAAVVENTPVEGDFIVFTSATTALATNALYVQTLVADNVTGSGAGLTNLIPTTITNLFTGTTNIFINAGAAPINDQQWDITLTNSAVLTITNAIKHGQTIVLCLQQNTTGGFQVYGDTTISGGDDIPIPSGGSLSVLTTVSKITYLKFKYHSFQNKWHFVGNLVGF